MYPRQIVIDKDVFQGENTGDLRDFARSHFLILPEVLMYECATDQKGWGQQLLCRFRDVMLAGAYTCPNAWHIIEREASSLQPYGFLGDLNETLGIRKEFKKYRNVSASNGVGHIYKQSVDSARKLLGLAQSASNTIAASIPEADKQARKLETTGKSDRLKLWLSQAEDYGIHKLAIEKAGHLARSAEKYCLSEDWITWHYFRLISALSFEYIFLRKGKGEDTELIGAEHDLQDMEYVLLLSRADGLLTRDKKLVKPLAKAAFPDKDIFSSLDEVPEEYVCHWS